MAEPQQVDYGALADQARQSAPIDYGALAEQARAATPNFTTTNEKDAQGNAVVDAASSTWHKLSDPLVPQIAEAAHAIAKHIDAPALDRSKTVAQIRGFLAGSTDAAGNVAAGFTSPIGLALTLAGLGPEGAIARRIPALKSLLELPAIQTLQRAVQTAGGTLFAAHGADRVVEGQGVGEKLQGAAEMASGVAGAASGATEMMGSGQPRVPRLTPEEAGAVQFGEQRGIPMDAATKTGSNALRAAQKRVANSMGGEGTAERLIRQQESGLARVGGELADSTGAPVTTAEQAGTNLRNALTAKMQGHADEANQAYDAVRAYEEDPTNRMAMPLKPQAVDAIAEGQKAQLRRIVHELDAAPFTPRLLKPSGKGGGLEPVEGTGGAGAKVFDDIVSRMGGTSTPTRGVVQSQLETYLGGGPETNIVKAALEVGKARGRGQGGTVVSRPELPASAMEVPTRLEAERVTSEEMGLPVDLSGPKAALRPVYEQMKRQMPLTQQQASPGLKALENILTGPDYAPLSQIDRDLGAIKKVAREQGGLAKMAAAKLETAVTTAAKNGSPDVWASLKKGREATVAKYATSDVLDSLNSEPVKTIRSLIQPKDASIEKLRTVTQHVPQQTPEIARAYLEDLLSQATAEGGFQKGAKLQAEWQKLGAETKKILFPSLSQRVQLDHFFLLAKRLADNPNPSGTAHTLTALNFGSQPLMWGLAKLLYTPSGVRALSKLMVMDLKPTPALLQKGARAAGWSEVAQAAKSAGAPLVLPRAATAQPEEQR